MHLNPFSPEFEKVSASRFVFSKIMHLNPFSPEFEKVSASRFVFSNLTKMYDGVFFAKIVNGL